MSDDCIFCKIIKGEIPSYKIYEDDYTWSFQRNMCAVCWNVSLEKWHM